MDNHPTASLYVGDLDIDVTEFMLIEKFNQAGHVQFVRVFRDFLTKRSLGYAYVKFLQHADAKRALETMNYDPIKGRPCRIMWYQPDSSLRRSGLGNIIIQNLDLSIDSKALHNIFSAFGNILSCKVATLDDHRSSKGFGFVHFDTPESAHLAIQNMNGTFIKSKKVYVGNFISRDQRNNDPA